MTLKDNLETITMFIVFLILSCIATYLLVGAFPMHDCGNALLDMSCRLPPWK